MTQGLSIEYRARTPDINRAVNKRAQKPGHLFREDLTDPPHYLLDEIAIYEWKAVAKQLAAENRLNSARRAILVGYCSALAKAIRAEETLVREGRYYETETSRGSLMRRRHPAAQDAEQAWNDVRRFGKQLGIVASDDDADAGSERRAILK
jgi:P27 family predicted phage terminase small subunit